MELVNPCKESLVSKIRYKKSSTGRWIIPNSRMYLNKYPDVGDVVMAKIIGLRDIGADVELLEYNNISGIIQYSELSRKRIHTLKHFIRVGNMEALQVVNVDEKKGYIDLSKKYLQRQEINECIERYQQSKKVHNILRNIAETQTGQTIYSLEELYQKIIWPLNNSFEHALDTLNALARGIDIFTEDCEVDETVKQSLIDMVNKLLTPKPKKVQAHIELTCFGIHGIDGIKNACKDALDGFDNITIALIKSPDYVIYTTTIDTDKALQRIEDIIKKIKKNIKKYGGECNIKKDPYIS